MPALEQAMAEVDKLDKSSISEIKAYTKPPAMVETVLQAVMILFNKPIDWGNAKKVLGEANFLTQIKSFDKDNVSSSTSNKIKKYIDSPTFTPAEVKKVIISCPLAHYSLSHCSLSHCRPVLLFVIIVSFLGPS